MLSCCDQVRKDPELGNPQKGCKECKEHVSLTVATNVVCRLVSNRSEKKTGDRRTDGPNEVSLWIQFKLHMINFNLLYKLFTVP